MRYFVIALLLILLGCENQKTLKQKGQLEIIPKYCKYNTNVFHFPTQNVKLFKQGNPTEIKILDTDWSRSNHTALLSDLEYGDYYIEYISTYNLKNTVKISLNQPKKQIEFCVDYVNYKDNKNILLIDDFQNGETIILDFSSQGCFHSSETPNILKLTKSNNKISASYLGKNYDMSETQIALFREFEIELRYNHSSGCTTVDSYGITKLGKSYKSYAFTDGSCEWRGFHHLLDTLKIIQ